MEPTGSDATTPARLQITGDESGGQSLLKLVGELDIASAPQLERALEGVGSGASRRLIIDLAELSFMDSTGLRALLQAHRLASETERELVLRPGPRQVQRVFELSGTIDTFTFED